MTDNETMTKILGDIITITDTKCLETISNTARSRREDLAQRETALWNINDDVQLLPELQHRKPYGAIGKIKKINKVKIKVDFNGCCWTVPKTMLVKVA